MYYNVCIVHYSSLFPSRLINHANIHRVSVEGIRKLLDSELKWLQEIRVSFAI